MACVAAPAPPLAGLPGLRSFYRRSREIPAGQALPETEVGDRRALCLEVADWPLHTRTVSRLLGRRLPGESFLPSTNPKGADCVNIRRTALTLATLMGAIPSGARAGTVWTALASEKIRPSAPARAQSGAAIAAARNEFEAFQVVVTGPATRVSAEVTDFTGPGTISGVHLYREALIDLKQPSGTDGGTGAYPDALVPAVDDVVGEKRNAFPFDVAAGESRAIWVEVLVPADARPGSYGATVTIHAGEGDTSVPARLEVWDFALPSTASLKTSFAMTYGGVPRAHGVSGEALTQLRQRYAQLALDHRISLSDLWDDGQLDFGDWSHLDGAYGPFLDGSAPTRLPGARLTSLQSGAPKENAQEHARWAEHFRSRGWFDQLFQYTCDEPPLTCAWSDILPRTQAAKQGDPAFRTLVTTDIDQATRNGVDGAIDLLVPVINFMEDRSEADGTAGPRGEARPRYDRFLASGPEKELWLYQSCMSHGCGGTVDIGNPSAADLYWTGWPTYAIDASAVRARSMEWLSFRYGATGELYYETTQAYYDRDPWVDQQQFSGNGDGTLFYPGTTGRIGGGSDIPVASIRLKMIREGMEDFEYLKLLSDLGGAGEARRIAQELFPHAWQADAAPEALMAAREAVARKILALSHKDVPPPGASVPAQSVEAASGPDGEAVLAAASGGCGAGAGGGLGLLLVLPALLSMRRLRRWRR